MPSKSGKSKPAAATEKPVGLQIDPTHLVLGDINLSVPVPMLADQSLLASLGEPEHDDEVSPPQAEVAPPDKATPNLIGFVDTMSLAEIRGWAWDPAQPDTPIAVELMDGDMCVLRVVADSYRIDLHANGIGNGQHGFIIATPAAIFQKSRHYVRICRASDGIDLANSGQWLSRDTAGFDQMAAEHLEQQIFGAIDIARHADDLNQPIAAVLTGLNTLVNARMALAHDKPSAGRTVLRELPFDATVSDWMRDLLTKLQHDHPPVYFEPAETPLVSIVIPVHNKFGTTYNCLKSILLHPSKVSFEIIVVDDCSTDETLLASLVVSGGCRVHRNESNLGFVRSSNAGAALARGTYLFFLNNDTLVRDGWLDELVATFESVPNVGIAGAKLLFEDGTLQEAGGIIWRLGDGWNWGRGKNPADPSFSYLRDADWVSGAALMIPTDLFRSLGGFDELYVPAYYEDTDLAFRVRALGKRVVVQPASEIVHLEGVSNGTDVHGTGMKRYQLTNLRKFQQRWADTLALHRYNGEHPELEAERSVARRAFFIDETVPTPDKDAGSNAALEHMVALMALGYKVTFLPADNMAQINPYTANLQKIGVECLYAPYYWSVEEVFRKTRVKPDLVYLHRYNNASKYATMVRRYFPDCQIVFNVADLHFLRMEREAALTGDLTLQAKAAQQRRVELSTMHDVDRVIVHSSFEQDLLTTVDPELPITVVPWTIHPRPTQLPFASRSGFAFVGGYNHPPNVDAATYLASDIMPLVRKLTKARAYLVGSSMPPSVTALQSRDIDAVGYVPELASILHRMCCTVVPLRYGAGVKGKVLESFAHGIPCVISEVAAEGLDMPETLSWLIARSPQEFADKIAKLHSDEALNERLAQAGLAFIESNFSGERVTQIMRDMIAAL
jgi:GT2 family glycosyltransferase/glycosyltransferase involved in cell wall biosynthesis